MWRRAVKPKENIYTHDFASLEFSRNLRLRITRICLKKRTCSILADWSDCREDQSPPRGSGWLWSGQKKFHCMGISQGRSLSKKKTAKWKSQYSHTSYWFFFLLPQISQKHSLRHLQKPQKRSITNMTLRIRGIDMDMERVWGIFTRSTIPKGEVNTIHTTTMDSTEGRINPWLNQIINNDL